MKPATRRALLLLLTYEWVSGNELFHVAGTRYGARLSELKPLGYRWEKKWRKGSAVPYYHLLLPSEQQELGLDAA